MNTLMLVLSISLLVAWSVSLGEPPMPDTIYIFMLIAIAISLEKINNAIREQK